MKIEKISDTQIRCTLNKADLQSRELKISELAYGTEKAKDLFHDMIAQASDQFGFEADEVPLMIEAIPVSLDCIVLIITKVDDPEELDTRFSRFSPSDDDTDESDDNIISTDDDDFLGLDEIFKPTAEKAEPDILDGAKEVSDKKDNFVPISETIASVNETTPEEPEPDKEPEPVSRLFSFVSWDEAATGARNVIETFDGSSRLYKDAAKSRYLLYLTGYKNEGSQFIKACNELSEYGKKEKFTYSTLAYLNEHCEPIIKDNAIRILCEY